MRIYILTMGLLAGVLLLTACQNDALPAEMAEGTAMPVAGSTDGTYLNLRIVNGVETVTRATTTGTTAENTIYDGILVIFKGNGESTATLQSAVAIDQLINNPGTSTSVDVIQRLPEGTHPYPATGVGKLYVMALLNTTATGLRVSGNMLYLNGTSLSGYTRAQLQSSVINAVGSTEEHVGLYMASKPKGTGSTPEQTAIQIYDPTVATPSQYLYDREEDITASSSKLTLNVERAAAKVSVTNAATTITSINLNGNGDSHPTVHRMTWTPNNYYTQCYAISGGTGATITPRTFTATDFSLYPQRSLSGDAIYISEGSTDIIVEVQLKDGSFLMDDCYVFYPLDDSFTENSFHDLYPSASQFVAYLKSGWAWQRSGYDLSTRSADDIYGNMKMEMSANGSVTFTFTMDTTGYSEEERAGLTRLKTFLDSHTKGFRNGKMYYTYTVNPIERNNAYSLTLQTTSISGVGRPTP